MLKVTLKFFLLATFSIAGLSSVSDAQPSLLTGEWVGNTDVPPSAAQPAGRAELLRLSLTEDAGELRLPLASFKQKLTLVRREGSTVRFELGLLKLVMNGTIAGDEIIGDAEIPGTKARFHLARIAKVKPEILASYVGAYRFRNGNYFVIDRFDYMPDILHVIDAQSGEVRAIFPRSETEFISGPALYVTSPVRQTINFRANGADVMNSELPSGRGRARMRSLFATRVPLRQEEVIFKNGDVTLAGTLVTPATPVTKSRRRPAVVFTHGGGAQLREVMWGLGYLYAARGFAVLSYDKRGVGKSTGNWREASFEDLADDAVAAAKFLQSRSDIDRKGIGFWGLSQGGWIAPLAASRLPGAAFAVALSGGGLSPAQTELFDTEYELTKAGYSADEVKEAVAWQRLKNEIISSPSANEKWDEYTRVRAIAKDKKWFRHRGIDVYGAEKRDDPFWTHMRLSYTYDPAPTLRASKAPLLAIFGELDTPEGVKAQVSAIKQILDPAGRKDYLVRVYPNGSHNLMEVPPDNPNESVRLKRFPPGFFETMVDWTTTQVRQHGKRK